MRRSCQSRSLAGAPFESAELGRRLLVGLRMAEEGASREACKMSIQNAASNESPSTQLL